MLLLNAKTLTSLCSTRPTILTQRAVLLRKNIATSTMDTHHLNPSLNGTSQDRIHINNLRVKADIGLDRWNQNVPQRCFINMTMLTDFSAASKSDDLKYSLNYASVSNDVVSISQNNQWENLFSLARGISKYCTDTYKTMHNLNLKVSTNTLHLRCQEISCHINPQDDKNFDIVEINDLRLLTLIGIFQFEREQKQNVTLNIKLPWPKHEMKIPPINDIINKIITTVEESTYLTVEALISHVLTSISENSYYSSRSSQNLFIDTKVIKLNAITDTDGVGVSSCKTISELNKINQGKKDTHSSGISKKSNTVYIAFGSNIGNRFENITKAIDLLNINDSIKVLRTSSTFESEPMYFEDQNQFLNGVLEIDTTLTPSELLKVCKEIEYKNLGREKHFDNGPRTLDLDIIFWINNDTKQTVIINEPDLKIPHERMLERTFVLEPLCELIPRGLSSPYKDEPFEKTLETLYNKGNASDILTKIIPLPKLNGNERFLKFKNINKQDLIFKNVIKRKNILPTYLMGILNTTPDSFSDGGVNFNNIYKQLQTVKKFCEETINLNNGIIIDIGGCSTRPNSVQVDELEEINRTIPLIESIRRDKSLPQDRIILSIDTYRAKVAELAIKAGADIINDISGGKFDSELFDAVSKHPNVAYVLSHIRGDIDTMNKMIDYSEETIIDGFESEYIYGHCITEDDLNTRFIRNVGKEISKDYRRALKSGIKRWQIILDPGLGFAKSGNLNLKLIKENELLKNYSNIINDDYVTFRNMATLLGPSRKKFIGNIIKENEPLKRDFATGAMVATCIEHDADIVRVHNVEENAKVIKLSDSIFKNI